MGKTALAKTVYSQLSIDFSYCCFHSNMQEREITCLHKQLVSTILKGQCFHIKNILEGKKVTKQRLPNKKVLLLLDDAHKASQLDALVQKHEWFDKGSKNIITTRDRGILNTCKTTLVDEAYELIGMDFDHSLKLFSKHAFRRDYPLEQYISHSERIINICHGLPLVFEVMFSFI
ncbi:hypothetical protein EUGRSUZ_E01851 [Eucalyptus grandis]|uniref:NB-ARC domain-containing protein n=2 Tax=Eucalyptus grandis TaxID=71139 RepID=A0A059C634_EUCGR|nr:hypothetical protein EUGRSUZ_E01851 [Eucalyptus grandis]